VRRISNKEQGISNDEIIKVRSLSCFGVSFGIKLEMFNAQFSMINVQVEERRFFMMVMVGDEINQD
jgi:hypothetical protein